MFQNTYKVYPNPATCFITISDLKKTENYKIYTIIGKEIQNGKVSTDGRINMQNLANGMCFFKPQSGVSVKVVKQ